MSCGLFFAVVAILLEIFFLACIRTIAVILFCSLCLWTTLLLMTFWLINQSFKSPPLCHLNLCLFLLVKSASSSFYTKAPLICLSIAFWLASKFSNSSMVGNCIKVRKLGSQTMDNNSLHSGFRNCSSTI